MTRLKAAIFDLDGLMIDSEPLWDTAKTEVFASVDLTLTPAMCAETMGFRQADMVAYWYKRRPWTGPTLQEIETEIVERLCWLMAAEVRPMDGLVGVLDDLTSRGIRLAVASSSPLRVIEAALESLSVRSLFEVVCSAEAETYGKPAPDVYSTAIRLLHVDPDEAFAFEDSAAGVRSALDAGLRVIAVPAPFNRPNPIFRSAHLVLESLADFRLTDWTAKASP